MAKIVMVIIALSALASGLDLPFFGSQWYCGPTFSKFLMEDAEWFVKKKCESRKDEINSCCERHDNCYSELVNRGICDEMFCQCLKAATAKRAKQEATKMQEYYSSQCTKSKFRLHRTRAKRDIAWLSNVVDGMRDLVKKHVNVTAWDGDGCQHVEQGFCFAVKKFGGLAYDEKKP